MIEFGGKKQVIIIHGCSSIEEKEISPEMRTHDKHWIPWVRKELSAKGIATETPRMPDPWEPSYEKFKEVFSKYKITENTTLIGHSCGCAFLVRWLGDSKQKIDKLILVAPWKIAREDNEAKKAFYEYPIDETIKSRVKKIIMFTAENEAENGKKSLQMYHDVLGGEIIDLQGRGHYTLTQMGTEEFPELIENILSSK